MTPNNVPSLTIGGRVFTDLANLITLIANPTTANPRSTFRKMGPHSGAGYQVTAGKTLKILALTRTTIGGTGGETLLAQSDNDVGSASTTAFTSPIYFGSESNVPSTSMAVGPAVLGSKVEQAGEPLGTIAAGKFFGVDGLGQPCLVMAYGYEV